MTVPTTTIDERSIDALIGEVAKDETDLHLRLRETSPGLLALPWMEPLAEWDATEVPLRDVPVGPSRHLVRFVETDGALWAIKELPLRVAAKEYAVLRELEV